MEHEEQWPVLPMVAVRTTYGVGGQIVHLTDPNGNEYTLPVSRFIPSSGNGDGKLYEVEISAAERVAVSAKLSEFSVEEFFPTTVGYVQYFDPTHKFYHIYDNLSRHFVARGDSTMPLQPGDFVTFCPVIPKEDPFKSAIVIRKEGREDGIAQFGTFLVRVLEVDLAKWTFKYRVLTPLPELDEGWFSETGVAFVDDSRVRQITVGGQLRVIMFLKRGKDGEKYNYIAEILD